ncbi:MAG: DNA-binding domain-containing protein, partial [Immundisolibacterales bacterium]|nr:DNA-binding domain-containing protein [Immundisolibacterales bacterium]
GLGWLGQEPAALRALAAYFADGPSELRAIAEEAERRIGLALARGPPVSAPAAPPAEEAAADRADATQPQPATTDPAPERTPPPAIGGEGAGWEWINWVRTGLRDGSVPVNAPGAWLHNIEGEAYVVAPACFEAFAAGRDLAPVTVRHRVVRLRRHRQRAAPSGATNLFRAALADGSRVKGMVFPGELVWDDQPPPRANARLVGKSR